MYNEVTKTYFKVLSRHLHEGIKQNNKKNTRKILDLSWVLYKQLEENVR
jgi:hypothetical protein